MKKLLKLNMDIEKEKTKKAYSKNEVKTILEIKYMTKNLFTDEEIYEKMLQYKEDNNSIIKSLKEGHKQKQKHSLKTFLEGGLKGKEISNNYNKKDIKKENYFINDNKIINESIELDIKNINYNATENELKMFFSKYGKVIVCKILRDENYKSKGIGFIKFSDYNLMKIMSIVSGRFKKDIYFKGRKLKIELAKNNEINKKPLMLYYVLPNRSSCCIFKSMNNKNIIYFIYSLSYSIKVINIVDDKIILEIKNAHKNEIKKIDYYSDIVNKKDILISIDEFNNIKLWDSSNWECFCDFKNVNDYYDFSFLIYDNNNYYFLWSYIETNLIIEVSDIKGNLVKKITDIERNEDGEYQFSFYYYLNNKKYIISSHFGFIQSIDYTKNKIYHVYYNNGYKEKYFDIKIIEKDSITKLISFSNEGLMKIWNFHTGSIINNIKLYDNTLVQKFFLKDDNTIYILQDNVLKNININNGRMEYILKNITPKNMKLKDMKKINHPQLGECFICPIERTYH